ncbi:DUF444 family protein [bacterium]|nr:DUF444 family protein [bacterium]
MTARRPAPGDVPTFRVVRRSPYAYGDLPWLQALDPPGGPPAVRVGSLDELMQRDARREEDGFPRKIRIGKLVKPARGGQKVVVVPTTVEEKLLHDNSISDSQEGGGGSGGSGEGDEGEVIGEQPVRPEEGEGDGQGPGQGEGAEHELESNAYDLGRILTEQFNLPNLEEKGRRRSLTRYTYDLTDRNRGFGQLLDKKATLRRIIQTNIALGRIDPRREMDPTGFLIAPRDRVYRVLSRERDFESQAVVFFLRDYSGSMGGKPTELVVSQHVLIYSWLLYQYGGLVETRFILHDTEAKEVEDFYTYHNSQVAGGTKVASAFRLMNEIVREENLQQDYNIYAFYGTDGDDWDTEGKETLPQIEEALRYVARAGVSITERSFGARRESEVEKYLEASGLLESHARNLRLDVMPDGADEARIIEGIRVLTAP